MGAKEGAPVRNPSEALSEKEALGILRDEFREMGPYDQAVFLARLGGAVGGSFVLVPTGENGTGKLIETEKALAELLKRPKTQEFSGEP